MNLLASPLFAIFGLILMSWAAWLILRVLPLLEVESRAHRNTLPLDGLRGLLASSVFFHHAHIWFYYSRTGKWSETQSQFYAQLGPAAVTLFFFVSGYLFWDKAIRRPEQITWALLLPNRMRRILPAYWVAVVLIFFSAFAASRFHLQEGWPALTKEVCEWTLGGFPNFDAHNINTMDNIPISAGVFWTLRVEWMFYVSLPLLLWFRKGFRVLLLFAAAAIAFQTFGWFHIDVERTQPGLLLSRYLQMFLVGFAVGMVAAYKPWGSRMQTWMTSHVAAIFALLCLGIELSRNVPVYSWTQSLLLAPLFFTVIVGNTFAGLLSSRPLRALGQMSYSLYILHGVLLFDLLSLWNRKYPLALMSPNSYVLLMWSVAIVLVAVSALNYWHVEKRFIQKKVRVQPSDRVASSLP